MRKKIISEKEIIKLTQETIKSFYDRKVENTIDYLDENFVWIGAFDCQFARNKKEFLEIVESELNSEPFTMVDEEFFVVYRSSLTYTVCAKFTLYANIGGESIVQTNTRISAVWKYVGDDLKLIHVHGSNSQDIPLNRAKEVVENNLQDGFFEYVTKLSNGNQVKKIGFRDTEGKYRYFFENEILYLEADLQNTYVHTHDQVLQVSGLLLQNAKKLTDSFFRMHKTYIVNCKFVTSLERYTVTLLEDIKLPVSKEKYLAFRDYISIKG